MEEVARNAEEEKIKTLVLVRTENKNHPPFWKIVEVHTKEKQVYGEDGVEKTKPQSRTIPENVGAHTKVERVEDDEETKM